MSSEERELLAYRTWQEASQKFDYYVTGIACAVFAYMVQAYKPVPLSWSPGTLEVVSMACLLGSIVAGFRQMECAISLFRVSAEKIVLLRRSPHPEMQEIINEVAGEAENRSSHSAEKHHVTRYRLLVLAFFLILVSKVWQAYPP